ncbi:hypothetical protein NA56DRAFT_707388 [Hyaloscypha hepaticicola]|uniref:Alcohol dehydrogenase-like N-terminal domain-containing protein n=1 Tax=Hyaloscypha hepaticicola TaxID=2082293 RepID=A0A2J6PUF6_9HELO|nr:hypothetical protein NA56DRAFT_707388 [Hyaloscypha hepaticicola]
MSLVVFTLLLDCLPSYPSNIIQMLRGTIGNMPSRELRTATQNLKVEERLYDGTWELLDMGHEISGNIVEIGSSITGFKVGQGVVNPLLDERYHGKESRRHLAVASHILRISGSKKGQDVVILGGGPIGLALLLLLMPKGVRKVIVSEVSNSRSRQAKKFGADLVVNEDFEDVLKVLSYGTASAEAMITSVVPLEKAVQDGCLELINSKAGYVRILTSLQSL